MFHINLKVIISTTDLCDPFGQMDVCWSRQRTSPKPWVKGKQEKRKRDNKYDGGNERNEREKTRNLFALVAKEKIEGDADRETRSGTRSLPGTLTATTLTLPSEG